MKLCPCGSQQHFSHCCEPIILGVKKAPTAEALMRSRYSAFVVKDIDYLFKSNHISTRHTVDKKATAEWAENSEWLGLEILSTAQGGIDDTEGRVEFRCRYKVNGVEKTHHELSDFRKEQGEWFFVDPAKSVPSVRQGPKIGRNDPCPCGSGKKFKKCCG